MIVRIGEIDFDINKKPIEKQSADILIHWVSLNLESGPPEFYKIHREATPDVRTATYLFNDSLKDGDCFSTHAGLLDVKLMIHAVIPGNRSMYERTFFNIAETIKEYQKKNQLRVISIYFHEMVAEQIGFMMKHLTIPGIKIIKIACREDQYKLVLNSVKKYKHEKLWDRLDRLFVNFMIWTGKIFDKNKPNPKK